MLNIVIAGGVAHRAKVTLEINWIYTTYIGKYETTRGSGTHMLTEWMAREYF